MTRRQSYSQQIFPTTPEFTSRLKRLQDDGVKGMLGYVWAGFDTAQEGADFANVVASFTDANPNADAGDFTASIVWGDGQTSAGTVLANDQGGFDVNGENTYAEAGTYTVTIRVFDAGGQLVIMTTTATISDAPLTATGTTFSLAHDTTFSGTVASFVDDNGSSTEADFAAVIDWGNGHTSDGTVVSNGTGYDVIGTNAYGAAGSYTVSVSISDTHGSTATASSTAVVAALSSVEAQAFSGVVASFTDSSSTSASDFSAQIDWGDGHTSTGSVSANGSGGFDVTGTNTYANVGLANIVVTVTRLDHTTFTVNNNIFVNDAPLSSAGHSVSGTQGEELDGTVASFTDPGTPADYTATINWGDGTLSDGTITPNNSGGYDVTGSNIYDSVGTFTITVTISDPGGSTTTATTTAQVAHGAPSLDTETVEAIEGNAFTDPVAHFVDPDLTLTESNFTATITVGNQTYTGVITANGADGFFVSCPTLVFSQVGDNPFSVTVTNSHGLSATASDTASVQDADLTPTPTTITPTDGTTFSGVIGSFTDANPSASAQDFTVDIDWGDGHTSTGTLTPTGGGTFHVSGSNIYASVGVYGVTITVTDAGGSETTIDSTAEVGDATLSAAGGQSISTTEGTEYQGNVLTFRFGNPAAVADEFTASIDWGDGSPATDGTVTANGDGTFDVAGDHTYADAEPQTIHVTVTDAAGTPATFTATAQVADAALTGQAFSLTVDDGQTYDGSVGTFQDANLLSPGSDFSATITWGDDQTQSAGRIVELGGGFFSVEGTHFFAQAGTFNIHVDISDVGGGNTLGFNAPVNSVDGNISAQGVSFTQQELRNPSSPVLVGVMRVDNPDFAINLNKYSALIDWGDQTATTTVGDIVGVPNDPLSYNIFDRQDHQYGEEGSYQVRVSIYVLGNRDPVATLTSSVLVTPATLSAFGTNITPVEGTVFNGVVATYNDAGVSNPNDVSAIIDWGDGQTSAGIISQDSIKGINTYQEQGNYTLRVTIFDKTGQSVVVTPTATVSDATFSVQAATINAQEGAGFTGTIATITDNDPNANPDDFTATVDWDGSGPTAARVVRNGDHFDVVGSFLYRQAGDAEPVITVKESDSPNQTRTVTSLVQVGDAALTGEGIDVTGAPAVDTGTVPVAVFSDDNPFSANTDFSVTIYWEGINGAADTTTGTVEENADHTFTVFGHHQYASAGSYDITVVVHDDVGGGSAEFTSTADVNCTPAGLATPVSTTGSNPLAITLGPDGKIYWVDFGSGQIERMNPDGTDLQAINIPTGSGSGPADLAFDPFVSVDNPIHSWLFFTEFNNYQIGYVDINDFTGTVHEYSTNASPGDTTVTRPDGLAFAPDGSLYVGLFDAGKVARFDVNNLGTHLDPVDVGAGSNPVAVTYGPNGDFYVTLFGTNQLAIIAPSTDQSAPSATLKPTGLPGTFDVDPYTDNRGTDMLSVTGLNGDTIGLYDQASTSVTTTLTVGSGPWESTAGSGTDSHNLYVAGSGQGQIVRVTTDPSTGDLVLLQTFNVGGQPTALVSVPGTGCDGSTDTSGDIYFTQYASNAIGHLKILSVCGTSVLATEGQEASDVTLATFTYAGSNAAPGNFRATVNWGDGTTSDNTDDPNPQIEIVDNGDGTFSVKGNHTYIEEDSNIPYDIGVTVTELIPLHGSPSSTVMGATAQACSQGYVADAPLTGTGKTVSGAEGTALPEFSPLATFTDPGWSANEPAPTYSVNVNWGDGQSDNVLGENIGLVNNNDGTFSIVGTHTYTEEGSYAIHITVTHESAPALYGGIL